jgi:hypothetical protein
VTRGKHTRRAFAARALHLRAARQVQPVRTGGGYLKCTGFLGTQLSRGRTAARHEMAEKST